MFYCLAKPLMTQNEPKYDSFIFHDDGTFPNKAGLPLIFLHLAFSAESGLSPDTIEKTFQEEKSNKKEKMEMQLLCFASIQEDGEKVEKSSQNLQAQISRWIQGPCNLLGEQG